MFPYLRLGPFLLQMPLLALFIGFWIGNTFVEREAVRLGLNKEKINNLIGYGLFGGIFGARLVYAAQYASVYLANPLGLFSLNTSTLSPIGGFLIGIAAAAAYGYRHKLPFRKTLDALTPGFAFFMIMIGVSHLLSGNAYGAPTRVPWAVYLWSDYRQPTQLYEIFFALMIFTIILPRMIPANAPGLRFVQFIALSAVARVFIEAFRGDSVLWLDGYRAAQVMGLLVLIICIVLLRQWEGTEQYESNTQ
ncbi:MAG: prolipoprotein diacylglyceryl transferase [Chloroflexi bacterium]|jgi:prolipoprotein diacylglyceryltransferase|nr:prolipoprotein diacylglyceryl transferase [Chloroflexota bacterium]MBI3174330.1 prolipoprotein diacylglyceryl transferase [Chloroflexota bacterium]MBN8582714.1 prolipoprotein diacylglyceryl transferase [Anaerolineae bacterium]